MNPCEAIPFNYMGSLAQWAKNNCVPLNGTFELTPFCNFQCVMCYVRLTKEQAAQQGPMLRAEDWIAIARQAKELGMLNLCLTGGEPFTHPDFWEIYSELNKMGFLITILSNGYLIDETVIDKFKEYGAPCCIRITLYGASDETYWSTCHCKDGFSKVSKAVQLLQDAKIPLKLTSTIVKENMGDLRRIYRFAEEHKISMQHTISVLKSDRGVSNTAETSRLSFEDYADELTLDALTKRMHMDNWAPFDHCGSRKVSFWMTWNGHMQLCAFLSKPYVKYSGDFNADWLELDKKLYTVYNPVECADCKWRSFCRRCPGALCAESGDPGKIDACMCSSAKCLQELYLSKLEKEAKRI